MWKDFFYFTRAERLGIIVLLAMIAVVIVLGYVLELRTPPLKIDDAAFMAEYSRFKEELARADSLRKISSSAYRRYDTRKPSVVVLQPFDPNVTDSAGFRELGLPAWMAVNILKYRAKGGVFRTPQDFRKVYGLTDEQFEVLLPYIYIDESFRRKQRDTVRLAVAPAIDYQADTLKRVMKYAEGTVIDLNTADTTELKKIPGIGSGNARRIVGYRKRLGGFRNVDQLGEIAPEFAEMTQWFSVSDSFEVVPIRINKAGIEKLRSHPYLNFYQAKVIVEHRKKKGKWKRFDQLSFYEEFTADDLQRLRPYLSFE